MRIDRKRNAIRNGIWGYVSKFLNMLFPFLLRTVIIYYLGEKYLGVNSLFTSILQILSLSELGIGSAIVFSMYKPIADNNNAKINSLLNLYRKIYRVIGLVILFAGLMLMPFLNNLIKGDYPTNINIYIVYLGFLINSVISYELFGYRLSLLNAFQRNDISSKIQIISNAFLYLISSLLIVIFKNYYFYIITLILSTIINNTLMYILTKKHFGQYKCEGEIDKSEKLKIKNNVIALVCHKIGATVLNSSDNIVISKFLGLAILAYYNNYYYIMNSVLTLITIMFAGLTGGLGNSLEIEKKEKNRDYFNKILFFNAYITIVFSTIMISLFQDFITLWLGEKYLLDIFIVCLLGLYFYVRSIRRTILVFRDAAGLWWQNRYQPLVSATFNIVLNIILVKYIGLYGIIISTIAAIILIDIPWETKVFLKNKLDLTPQYYYKKLVLYLIIMIFTITSSLFISNYIHFSLIVNLVLKLFISFVISNLFIFIIFKNTNEYEYFIELLTKFFNKIKKKNI